MLEEVCRKGVGKKRLLEVGAGAGNTAFPILKANENEELFVHACDYSKTAVDLIRGHAEYDSKYIQAEVWDLASAPDAPLPPGLSDSSIDVVLLIFVFSALSPGQWEHAVRNVWRVLKPGGEVCLRDYGRGDLAQVRFKKGRFLEENFYVRGDGTRVYFFSEEELRGIWGGGMFGKKGHRERSAQAEGDQEVESGDDGDGDLSKGDTTNSHAVPAFEITSLGVDRRLLINRQKQLKMYRCWMQGRFHKLGTPSIAPAHEILQDSLSDLDGDGNISK